MKKLIILSAIAVSGLFYNTADAQIRVHFGFHFAPRRIVYAPAPRIIEAQAYDQPAPVYDDANDDYYYLPDVDAYYSVNEQCYYYYDGDDWVSAAYLPGEYRNFDWRTANRFEVRATRPYLHNDLYRSRYNGHPVAAWAHNDYGNHNNNGYVNRNEHLNQRPRGGYNPNSDNRGWENHNQPEQNSHNGGNNQHFDNHGNGGHNFNQNQNHVQDMRGGNDHIARNNNSGGSFAHRMSKF